MAAIERALTRCATGPSHPAILRIFAVRREGRHLVVQCEKPDGAPLSDVLRHRRIFSFDDTIDCLRPLGAAIEHVAKNQMPPLDLAVTSIVVQSGDPASVGGPLAPKARPLALTVLNQLKDSRQQGKTMLYDPLQIDPAGLEMASVNQGIASLAALAFELLSGHPAPARTADYRPIAPLSEGGNICLRHALEQISAFALASDFIDELAAGARGASHTKDRASREGQV